MSGCMRTVLKKWRPQVHMAGIDTDFINTVFNSKIEMIHLLEAIIAKSANKLKAHSMKWGTYENNQIDIQTVSCCCCGVSEGEKRVKRN